MDKQRGFSMIELVTVLVLLGVLSAVAFARFGQTSSYTEAVLQQELLAYFRLAQRVAVAHQDIDTSLSLTRNGDQLNVLVQFDGQTVSDTLQAEAAISAKLGAFNSSLANGVTYRVLYNDSGDLASITSPANLAVTQSVQLTIGARFLCIAPTGFAYEGACL